MVSINLVRSVRERFSHQCKATKTLVTRFLERGETEKGVAIHQLFGCEEVARFMLSNSPIFRETLPTDARVELVEVNGQPALITRSRERAFAVLTIDVEADQIKAIRFVANPEKLAHVSQRDAPERK